MNRILLVDDDHYIRKLVSTFLGERGYDVTHARHGVEALSLLEKHDFHLVIVDIMMPEMDGYELTKEITGLYHIPIIMLTAKSQIQDKERGFSLGTDDYLVKPFELKELLFRIKALMRRYYQNAEMIVRLNQVEINKINYEVHINDATILLPLKEFDLLFLLASNPRRVFTREQLITQIWGSDYEGNDRTVDVHIKRLRERFSPLTDEFVIQTIRGVGYSLEVKS